MLNTQLTILCSKPSLPIQSECCDFPQDNLMVVLVMIEVKLVF